MLGEAESCDIKPSVQSDVLNAFPDSLPVISLHVSSPDTTESKKSCSSQSADDCFKSTQLSSASDSYEDSDSELTESSSPSLPFAPPPPLPVNVNEYDFMDSPADENCADKMCHKRKSKVENNQSNPPPLSAKAFSKDDTLSELHAESSEDEKDDIEILRFSDSLNFPAPRTTLSSQAHMSSVHDEDNLTEELLSPPSLFDDDTESLPPAPPPPSNSGANAIIKTTLLLSESVSSILNDDVVSPPSVFGDDADITSMEELSIENQPLSSPLMKNLQNPRQAFRDKTEGSDSLRDMEILPPASPLPHEFESLPHLNNDQKKDDDLLSAVTLQDDLESLPPAPPPPKPKRVLQDAVPENSSLGHDHEKDLNILQLETTEADDLASLPPAPPPPRPDVIRQENVPVDPEVHVHSEEQHKEYELCSVIPPPKPPRSKKVNQRELSKTNLPPPMHEIVHSPEGVNNEPAFLDEIIEVEELEATSAQLPSGEEKDPPQTNKVESALQEIENSTPGLKTRQDTSPEMSPDADDSLTALEAFLEFERQESPWAFLDEEDSGSNKSDMLCKQTKTSLHLSEQEFLPQPGDENSMEDAGKHDKQTKSMVNILADQDNLHRSTADTQQIRKRTPPPKPPPYVSKQRSQSVGENVKSQLLTPVSSQPKTENRISHLSHIDNSTNSSSDLLSPENTKSIFPTKGEPRSWKKRLFGSKTRSRSEERPSKAEKKNFRTLLKGKTHSKEKNVKSVLPMQKPKSAKPLPAIEVPVNNDSHAKKRRAPPIPPAPVKVPPTEPDGIYEDIQPVQTGILLSGSQISTKNDSDVSEDIKVTKEDQVPMYEPRASSPLEILKNSSPIVSPTSGRIRSPKLTKEEKQRRKRRSSLLPPPPPPPPPVEMDVIVEQVKCENETKSEINASLSEELSVCKVTELKESFNQKESYDCRISSQNTKENFSQKSAQEYVSIYEQVESKEVVPSNRHFFDPIRNELNDTLVCHKEANVELVHPKAPKTEGKQPLVPPNAILADARKKLKSCQAKKPSVPTKPDFLKLNTEASGKSKTPDSSLPPDRVRRTVWADDDSGDELFDGGVSHNLSTTTECENFETVSNQTPPAFKPPPPPNVANAPPFRSEDVVEDNDFVVNSASVSKPLPGDSFEQNELVSDLQPSRHRFKPLPPLPSSTPSHATDSVKDRIQDERQEMISVTHATVESMQERWEESNESVEEEWDESGFDGSSDESWDDPEGDESVDLPIVVEDKIKQNRKLISAPLKVKPLPQLPIKEEEQDIKKEYQQYNSKVVEHSAALQKEELSIETSLALLTYEEQNAGLISLTDSKQKRDTTRTTNEIQKMALSRRRSSFDNVHLPQTPDLQMNPNRLSPGSKLVKSASFSQTDSKNRRMPSKEEIDQLIAKLIPPKVNLPPSSKKPPGPFRRRSSSLPQISPQGLFGEHESRTEVPQNSSSIMENIQDLVNARNQEAKDPEEGIITVEVGNMKHK